MKDACLLMNAPVEASTSFSLNLHECQGLGNVAHWNIRKAFGEWKQRSCTGTQVAQSVMEEGTRNP